MNRYIDADKLYKSVKDNVGAYWSEGEEVKEECLNEIDNAPTADVVEVRHGEWGFDGTGWTCSECDGYGGSRYKYCPHCGAKMDGERREECL